MMPAYARVREGLREHPKRWLITGVAGFIGSHLLEELLGLDQIVIGLDDFSTGRLENLADVLGTGAGFADRFTLIEGDIRDPATCRSACEGVDFVLHHAALASVPRSIAEPLVTNAVNVDGFVNMLDAARESGVARFVYASSSAIYGDATQQPQIETRVGRPLSPYAATKSINETYAMAFQMTYGLQCVGLRYYNIFGRRQDPNGAYAAVIPRWITNLLSGQPCMIFGDGLTTRDFCHVSNVVQANLLSATSDQEDATGRAYNIASSHSVTLNALFEMMRDEVAPLVSHAARARPSFAPFRPGDVRHSSASIEDARRLLQFLPSCDVRTGLAEAMTWYVKLSRMNSGRATADVR